MATLMSHGDSDESRRLTASLKEAAAGSGSAQRQLSWALSLGFVPGGTNGPLDSDTVNLKRFVSIANYHHVVMKGHQRDLSLTGAGLDVKFPCRAPVELNFICRQRF